MGTDSKDLPDWARRLRFEGPVRRDRGVTNLRCRARQLLGQAERATDRDIDGEFWRIRTVERRGNPTSTRFGTRLVLTCSVGVSNPKALRFRCPVCGRVTTMKV